MEFINLRQVTAGNKAVNAVFIVLDKLDTTVTKDGHRLTLFLVADKTAAAHLTLFNRIGSAVKPGDILRLVGGYCSLHQHRPTLYVGQRGVIEKIGEFTMHFVETPNISEPVNGNALASAPPGTVFS
eukprot:m.204240 g.204240  ORF g.204240 m.204240 type:complete len:127 (+) comp17743_c0_seq6:32-412(+)